MANNVDERIVEAKFDSSDFERGVDRTVKKLDELKQSLNIADAGKSVTDFAKATSEGAEKAGNALDKLSNRFSTFTGMIKQQILGGLASEVSNTFLSIEQSILGFVKNLSTGQIATGLDKYTEILNSVRTMTAAGVDQETAYEAVKRLGEYSDQTSYSLNQMTSGMSKLVAAGMKVNQAEKSMEGLANMCASAGVNIYDAQRAFLNFSQAYSSGFMRIQDWMSFESLNMATENVMKVFMEAGEKAGTLVKDQATGIYKTVNNINKKVKAGKQVAVNGFRDTLSAGWLDQKTLEYATATLSYFEDLGKDMSQLSDEELKDFAAKAYQAAKEARSFTDVMGTLKDVIATGWATTFELIFGKLDKATEFFTWLTESELADVIYSIGTFRNEVMTAWGADFADGGIFKAGTTGRDQLINALHAIDDLIGSIRNGLEGLLPDGVRNNILGRDLTFAEQVGYRLGKATRGFRRSMEELRDHFAEQRKVKDDDGEIVEKWVLKDQYFVKLVKYRDMIGGIISGIKGFFSTVGQIWDTVKKNIEPLYNTIEPVILAIGNAISTVLSRFTALSENKDFFKNIEDALSNLNRVIKPLIDPLTQIIGFIGDLVGFFLDMSISTFTMNVELIAESLGLLLEILGLQSAQQDAENGVGIIERWRNSLEAFRQTCQDGLNAIKTFFETLFTDIRKFLGLGEFAGSDKGGAFNDLRNFFDTNEFVKKMKESAKKTLDAVKGFFKGLPGRITTAVKSFRKAIQKLFLKDGYTKVTYDAIKKQFGEEAAEAYKERYKTELTKFIERIRDSVVGWVTSAPGTLRDAAKSMWTSVVNYFFNKEATKNPDNPNLSNADSVTDKVKALLSEWLNNLKEQAKGWAETKLDDIREVWSNVVNYLFSKFVLDGLQPSPEDNSKTLWEKLVEVFKTWFTSIGTLASDQVEELKPTLISLWEKVVNNLYATEVLEGVTVEDPEAAKSLTDKVVDIIKSWWTKTSSAVSSWAEGARDKFKKIWQDILTMIFGGSGGFKQSQYDNIARFSQSAANDMKTAWQKDHPLLALVDSMEGTIQTVGKEIGGLFSKLPGYIAEGINFKIGLFDDVLNALTGWLSGKNREAELSEPVENLISDFAGEAGEQLEKSEGSSEIISAVLSVGKSFYKTITETIPPLLSEAFTYISTNGGSWWSSIKTILDIPDGSEIWSDVEQGARTIGENIAQRIELIPGLIESATDSIYGLFKKKVERPKWALMDNAGEIIDESMMDPDELQQKLEDGTLKYTKVIEEVIEDTGILSGIKEIGSSFGEALVTLAPTILNGLNNVFSKVSEKTEQFTRDMETRDKNQGFMEWLAEYVGGEGAADSELFQSIKTFGETIFTFITETIPGFIEAAIEEVAVGVPKIINKVLNKNRASEVVKSSTGKPSEAENAFVTAMGEALGFTSDSSENILDSALTLAKGFSDTVEEVQKTEEEAIDDGLTWAERRDKKIKELQAEAEKIDSARMRYTGLYKITGNASLQTKKNLVSAATEYVNILEQIEHLKGLEEGESLDLSGYETESEDFLGGVQGILSGIKDVFSTIGTSDTVKVVTVCVAVMYALNSIRDMLSIADELEAPGYTAKWVAIGVAMTGIFGILGWITYLASQPDANVEGGRLQTTMDTMTKVGQFIKDLMAAVKDITYAMAVLEGASFFENLSEGGGFSGTFLKLAAGLLAPGAIGAAFEKFVYGLGTTFAQIGEAVDTFMTLLSPAIDKLADAAGKTEQAIVAVQDIKTLLSAFNDLVNHVGVDSIAEALEHSDVTALLTTEIQTDMTGNIIKAYRRDDIVAEDFISVFSENLENRILFIYQLSEILKNMADALKSLESVNDPAAQVQKLTSIFEGEGSFGAFGEFVDKMFEMVYNSIDKYGKNHKAIDVNQAAAGFSMLSSSLSVFSDGISELSTDKVTALGQVFDVFKSLAEAFAKADDSQTDLEKFIFGTNNIATFGQRIKMFGIYMKSFFQGMNEAIPLENAAEVRDTQQRIDFAIQVAQGMATAVNIIGSQGGVDLLEVMGKKLVNESLIQQIGGFIRAINTQLGEGISMERVQMVSTSITAIAELMEGIGALMASDPYRKGKQEDIPLWINGFLDAITKSFLGDNGFLGAGKSLGENLGAGLAEGIRSGTSDALAAAQEMAAAISGVFTIAWQIGSPSKLMDQYGNWIDEGLANGIAEGTEVPVGAMDDMATAMIERAKEILSDPDATLDAKNWAKEILLGGLGEGIDIVNDPEVRKAMDAHAKAVKETGTTLTSITDESLQEAFEKSDYRTMSPFEKAFHLYQTKLHGNISGLQRTLNSMEEPAAEITKGVIKIRNAFSVLGQLGNVFTPEFKYVLTHPLGLNSEGALATPGASDYFSALAADIQNLPNVLQETMGITLAELREVGDYYAPNLTAALFDSGLFEGNINKDNIASTLCAAFSEILQDVADQSDSAYTNLAVNMMTGILNSVQEQAPGTGQEMVATLFNTIKDTDPAIFEGLGHMFLAHMMQGMDPDDRNTVQNMMHLAEDFGQYFTEDLGKDNEPTITPVVDMSNIYAARDWLDKKGFGNGEYSFNTSGLNLEANAANPSYGRNPVETPRDYSGLINAISGQMISLNGAIDGVAQNLGNMQIVLDSGTLVGALSGGMNSRLGRMQFYASREGG